MIQFTCKRFKLFHIVGDNFPESDQHQGSTILNIWSHFGKNKTVLICPPRAGKSNQNSELLRSFVSSVMSVMASIDPDPSFLRN